MKNFIFVLLGFWVIAGFSKGTGQGIGNLLVAGVVALIVVGVAKAVEHGKAAANQALKPAKPKSPERPARSGGRRPSRDDNDDDLVTIRISGVAVTSDDDTDYAIGKSGAPGDAQWVAKGQTLLVKGKEIAGGMLYFGRGITPHPKAPYEPSLINPDLRIDWSGDYRESTDMDYWPSFNRIGARQRGSYLSWLMAGRRDPHAYIGFVFLFFYGLERRLLIDDEAGALSESEVTDLIKEIAQLLQVYQDSNSFHKYATALLGFLRLHPKRGRLVEAAAVDLPPETHSQLVKAKLGELTRDGKSLPAELVATWVLADDAFTKRMPAKRCPDAFRSLFVNRYTAKFGEGLKLKANRTKLVFEYKPASAGLGRHGEFSMRLGDIPDLTAAPSLLKPIQTLADECMTELEGFSRYMGKEGSRADSLDAMLLLPSDAWPTSLKKRMGELLVQYKVAHGGNYFLAILTLNQLLAHLNASGVLAKDKLRRLATGLEASNIGMEPDLRRQSIAVSGDDKVVLFTLDPEGDEAQAVGGFETAALCLELAALVAHADGAFDDSEMGHLRDQLSRWTHLPRGLDRHLTALLHRLRHAPSTLLKLRDRLSAIGMQDKQMIARVLTGVANADGTVTPKEVALLEKIYKTLGLDAQAVYSDLHAGAAGGAVTAAQPAVEVDQKVQAAQPAPVRLDKARIAALQADSKKVGALLHTVFSDPAEETPSAPVEAIEPAPASENPLGLDDAHAAFLHILTSRAMWPRSDLEDVAADMDLMLNGALERINDASFDRFDMAFTEGDDPIEVIAEAVHALEHA